MSKIISLHDVLEPLKQALLASRDVIISSQICGSKLQKVFTLGDRCWLPNTPPICIAIHLPFVSQYFWCPKALREGKFCQYSSHLYRSTPPICIAISLPFVSQYFWKNLGGHRDVPHLVRPPKLGIAIHGPMPVQGETFEELSGPLVHTNFVRKRYGPMIGPYEFPYRN